MRCVSKNIKMKPALLLKALSDGFMDFPLGTCRAGLVCLRQAHTRKSFLCRSVYRQPLHKFLPWLIPPLQIDQEAALLFRDRLRMGRLAWRFLTRFYRPFSGSVDHWPP